MNRPLLFAPLLVSSLFAQTPVPAQPVKPATGVIVGTVVDASTGKPIAGAAVSISGAVALASGGQVASLTGADGRFLFTSLAEADYMLTSQRGGYLPGSYGAIAPQRGGVPVELHDGEKRTDLVIKMWKPGAISGHVTDEAGEPLVGVTVAAWTKRTGRGLGTGEWSPSRSTRTDDRGVYRMSALAPESYLIFIEQTSASLPTAVLDEFQKAWANLGAGFPSSPLLNEVSGSRATGSAPGTGGSRMVGDQVETLSGATVSDADNRAAYVSQFYPAAVSVAAATPIPVVSGEERFGVDLQLRPVKTVRVSGIVQGPAGPLPFTRVTLAPQHSSSGEVVEAGTVTDALGRFTLLHVPDGAHVLQVYAVPTVRNSSSVVTSVIQNADGSTSATSSSNGVPVVPPLPPDPSLYAEMPLTTGDKDLPDVIVMLRTGARIKGRIEAPAGTTATPAQLQRISVSLVRADGVQRFNIGATPRTRVDNTGEVTSQGFMPGQYTVTAFGTPSGWALQSVMHGGIDVSQEPLDLSSDVEDLVFSFTTTPADLSGVVRDAKGAVVSGALVMIFPADTPLTDTSIRNPRRITRPIASTSGKYSAKNLSPGDYFVAAMAPDDPENVSAPAGGQFSIESLSVLRARASRTTIGRGEHRTLDLTAKGR